MKIIVDAFGGDNAPLEILKGCEAAIKSLDIDIILTGREDEIRKVAEENQVSLERMEIVDAPEVLTMEDHAGAIMKEKQDSSMAEGLRLVAEGKGDAFVSAGNSGALVVGATMIVKRIKGIKRVSFAPMVPNSNGFFMLIDGGANVDCRPEMLLQFGIMGSIYLEKVIGVEKPRIGLANVGTEDHKGGELQRQAFAMLKESKLNFIGNIEARDISNDGADVVVTDGFTGNIILKMFEGVVTMVMGKFKEVFTKNTKNKMATAILLKDMTELKKTMDYNEYGGAPVMGASKPVFKVHGSAKARTLESALRLTKAYVEKNVTEEISRAITQQE
ncbi:MAG: phosphate acyltransferase PlsX [Clostridium sp.]|uniref:phosphate acyltransferase PlsX n=1 Tax=Clostridium sp. TaxID=1506 RepID=UPI00291501F0|nr:phosphate acyltransferase PlsX [Clostridium sp.]MDU7336947.1 phosphate acyltransferase PlsX [Clostridium sp.]